MRRALRAEASGLQDALSDEQIEDAPWRASSMTANYAEGLREIKDRLAAIDAQLAVATSRTRSPSFGTGARPRRLGVADVAT